MQSFSEFLAEEGVSRRQLIECRGMNSMNLLAERKSMRDTQFISLHFDNVMQRACHGYFAQFLQEENDCS